MLLTLIYLAVSLYDDYTSRRRAMLFMRLLEKHLRRTSVLLRKHGLRRDGATTERHRLSQLVENDDIGRLENVLMEENGKRMLSVIPKIVLRLDGWVSYLDSQDVPIQPSYPASNYSYVLFETLQADNEENYLEQSFSVPSRKRVKVVDCVEPLAWKSGLPFGIVARCSIDNLAKLGEAFLQGTLYLDDMLELHQMMSVELKGSAANLLQTPMMSSAQKGGSSDVSVRTLWERSQKEEREGATFSQGEHGQAVGASGGAPAGTSASTARSCDGQQQTDELHVCDGAELALASDGLDFEEMLPFECRMEGDGDEAEEEEDSANLYEGSNESLASSVPDLRDVRGEAAAATADGADHLVQTVSEVVSLDGEVISEMMDSMALEGAGEGVGGESLSAPVAELAPETLTPLRRREAVRAKPPNVLVYCGKKDSVRQFNVVRDVLSLCLNPHRYTIYNLPHAKVATSPWRENTVLLVIASEKAYDGADRVFLDYFRSGGLVVSFGCSIDEFFVGRVRKSADLGVMALTAFNQWHDVSAICGRHVYVGCDSLLPDVTLRELATDTGSGYPVMLEASDELNNGVALLCQALLNKDPMEMAVNPEVFTVLKKSNKSRFEILRHMMELLGLDTEQGEKATFTLGVLVAKTQRQMEAFLNSLRPRLNNNLLRTRDFSLLLVDSPKEATSGATADKLPIVTNAASAAGEHTFNVDEYQRHLATSYAGQVLIYTDVLATTMKVVDILMLPIPKDVGLVVVAGRQTQGVGRGGNAWLSPPGCAMFSVLVRLNLSSELGKRVSFLQHIASLAVVQAITTIPGYESLNLRLKWPNDIYFGSAIKFGGVLVNSSIMQSTIHANIGIGVNVHNKDPTICLNDIITQYNQMHHTHLPAVSREQLIALTVNWIETLVSSFEQKGPEDFLRLYYKRWLHGNARVHVDTETGPEMKIVGLDEYGYLLVETPEGSTRSVHPDGNSFDMMRGLIFRKEC